MWPWASPFTILASSVGKKLRWLASLAAALWVCNSSMIIRKRPTLHWKQNRSSVLPSNMLGLEDAALG